MMKLIWQTPALILRTLIRAYQLGVAPLLGPRCRFTPSCSHYAGEAVTRHGAIIGSWLAVKRVARCHPWHEGGYDPVPESLNLTRPYAPHSSCCHQPSRDRV